jgi:hypothetical protein
VSINWYVAGAHPRGIEAQFQDLRRLLSEIRTLAPNKPVLVTELGLAASPNPDDPANATLIRSGVLELIGHPEVRGFAMWSDFADEGLAYSIQINPGTVAAGALAGVIKDSPGLFHGCVRMSDGSRPIGCAGERRK